MIQNILNRVQNWDKLYHLVFGAIAALSPWYPMTAILIVAFGKEVYDYFHPNHTPDAADAIATIVGGLVILQFLRT
jgi:hypothetical protein